MTKPEESLRRNGLRKDILAEDSEEKCRSIEAAIKPVDRATVRRLLSESPRAPVRRALIETDRSDPHGFERIIGESDLVSINFLTRGVRASRAVCRVWVPGPGGGGWSGTGFLIAPGLLMTNNHVLSAPAEASQAEADFGLEHDEDGVLSVPAQFNLAPHEIFFTDVDHDVTIVAVAPLSDKGEPLDRFGWLPLLPLSGKGLHGEWVTIIQHPGGDPKQIAVRANQIVELDPSKAQDINLDRFIHYTTDTEPGSSGAPVLNDQWQVVALHHKAVPKPRKRNAPPGAPVEWLANQGVRVSAINELLEQKRFSDAHVALALDRMERALGLTPMTPQRPVAPAAVDPESERDIAPHAATKWAAWKTTFDLGYDPEFLSRRIDLGAILGAQKKNAAPLKKGKGLTLDYIHFSSVIHKSRKFPIITAVNIDGAALVHPGKRSGKFRIDLRMDEKFQPAADFYEEKLGDDPVSFHRGHLVRRFDPCWGGSKADAKIADDHTFHYTNAAPQVGGFNSGRWLTIEDYILNQSQVKERKITVFTGCVFRRQDPEYGRNRKGGPWRVPVTFWKVVAADKEDGTFAATAFLSGQTKFVRALFEARVFSNLRQNTQADLVGLDVQTTIAAVEEETKLDFKALRRFDTMDALESTRKARVLHSPADIVF